MARRDSCEGCGQPLKRDEHGLCDECAADDPTLDAYDDMDRVLEQK